MKILIKKKYLLHLNCLLFFGFFWFNGRNMFYEGISNICSTKINIYICMYQHVCYFLIVYIILQLHFQLKLYQRFNSSSLYAGGGLCVLLVVGDDAAFLVRAGGYGALNKSTFSLLHLNIISYIFYTYLYRCIYVNVFFFFLINFIYSINSPKRIHKVLFNFVLIFVQCTVCHFGIFV